MKIKLLSISNFMNDLHHLRKWSGSCGKDFAAFKWIGERWLF